MKKQQQKQPQQSRPSGAKPPDRDPAPGSPEVMGPHRGEGNVANDRPNARGLGMGFQGKGAEHSSEYKLGSVQLAALREVPGWSLHSRPRPTRGQVQIISRPLALPKSGFPVNSLKSHLSIEHEEMRMQLLTLQGLVPSTHQWLAGWQPSAAQRRVHPLNKPGAQGCHLGHPRPQVNR